MYNSTTLLENSTDTEKPAKKKLVYIGEHDLMITNSLLKADFECIIFKNAFQALPWLKYNALSFNTIPDVIISDLEFVGGDAYSLFDYIKSFKAIKYIPFIVISDKYDKEEKLKALKKGFDDFYVLPFNGDDLYNRVNFLHQFKREKDKAKKEVTIKYEKKMPKVKRAIDILFSLTALLILSPLFLIVALIIKLESRGPVFYTSKRAGTGYKIINFYKFRSMRSTADKELKDLLHLNQYSGQSSFIKIKDDPRVTNFGKFLRKTSLDELPQLINVLLGDMSLVGNRPLPLYEAEKLTKDQLAKRFLAPAGITGLWQVTKRGKEEMSELERIQLDITYADKYSSWYDLKIMLKTFPAVIQKESV
ncbi:MAG TPA: sugar transferase [Cytophagales bacterium]|nr:sugar transferase [Cytophagales bacterium]